MKLTRLSLLAIVTSISFFSISCGRVDSSAVVTLDKEYPIKIMMTVNIGDWLEDPIIYLSAKQVTINEEWLELTITEGLVSDYQKTFCKAIRIENAKFSFPLGGRIEINYPDGKKLVIEKYGNEREMIKHGYGNEKPETKKPANRP